MSEQVKSKQRVADHGEVFTAEREVKAMCDLVKDECERIDSRFLEPACGDGNFLAEILRRKLAVVESRYKKNIADYEKNAILAATSIYGVDILTDNTIACRERMYNIWNEAYTKAFGDRCSEDIRKSAKHILSCNIVCGNALSMLEVDENQQDTDRPIIFPEWAFVMDNLIKRRDFRFDVLLNENDDEDNYMQFDLFGGASDMDYWEEDPVTHEIIPKPIKEYSPIDYRKIYTMEGN